MISGLLEWLLPNACVLCGGSLQTGARPYYIVCDGCRKRLPAIAGSRCCVCSRALISEITICTRCRQRSYHFASHLSLFEYRDQIQELLIRYKFENRRRIALLLADLMAPVLHENFAGVPLIPVPHRMKARRARGWDPVGEICRLLRTRHRIRLAPCLVRKGGLPQKSLDFGERLINLRGQIRLLRPLDMKKAVLLDDVFTTGATLDECARVLREGGCVEVHAVTVAID